LAPDDLSALDCIIWEAALDGFSRKRREIRRTRTVVTLPWLSPKSDLGASTRAAFSRYQRTDLSMSDTNTMTFGVVGAAIVHGPSSASTRREKEHSINRNMAEKNIDVDGYRHTQRAGL
jgi:hypothetical protein